MAAPQSPGVELQDLRVPDPTREGQEEEPEPASNGSVNADDATITIGNEKHLESAAPVVVKDNDNDGKDMTLSVRIRRRARSSVQQCCSMRTLKRKLPILQWLPSYRSILMWLCLYEENKLAMWLHVCRCILLSSNAHIYTHILSFLNHSKIHEFLFSFQYGLYSAFMGCFVYMFMGTSKDITLGPTAIMSLMVGTFAVPYVEKGDHLYIPQAVALAMVLTLMSGLLQLLMGLLNLGILVNYISHPVINSFTSAAAITIGVGQVKNVLGLKDISREFLHMVYETCAHIPETKIWDLVMGLVSMVLLFVLKKLRTIKWGDEDDPDRQLSIPVMVSRKIIWLVGTAANAVIVIGAAGLTACLIVNDIDVISITGNITSGLPSFEPPHFSGANMTTTEVFSKIGAGFIIVPLLGLVESIAIGKAFARVNNYKIDSTQELLAIGTANILSSFVHSYPVTGSFSRTAVNSQSGVKTPAGGLFTGALILLALAVLVQYCYYIPKAALAAVIIMAVIQMVDYKILPVLWRTNKWDLFVHIVTFVCSLCVGIEYGILIGIGISVLLLLYPMARPKLKVSHQGNVVIIQPDQGLFFPAIEYIEGKVVNIALADEKPKAVILDMLHISGVDYSSLHGIKSMVVEGAQKGIRVVLCEVNPSVTEEIVHEDITGLKICGSVGEALEELSLQAQSVSDEEEPFIAHL
ncbi:sodium-independent sulfate anion transporter-like [Littorina saxatilis]|uniref:sodium-independent sulfate anion transporter-like n=1 Tax=Littorina saxatilis TaxID=31220 RepID=UPI0038B67BDA